MKLIRRLKRQDGFTLSEVIVCFALLTILSAAVTMMITTSYAVFARLKTITAAQTVTDILLDKAALEIAGAQPGANAEFSVTVSDGSNDIPERQRISLRNRTGSPVDIMLKDGRMIVHYRGVTGNIELEPVDWGYDDAVYMGFEVTGLDFEIVKPDSNVIKVTVSVRHNTTEYTAERYIECYNYVGEEIKKITYGSIAPEESVQP